MKICDECGKNIYVSNIAFKILRSGREELLCISCIKKAIFTNNELINLGIDALEISLNGGLDLGGAIKNFLESEKGRSLIKSIAT